MVVVSGEITAMVEKLSNSMESTGAGVLSINGHCEVIILF